MTGAWINVSTRWGLTSVQAALNVLISVLGTVGIWSFSRYWWQRSARSLRDNNDVPLSTLLTLSGPGESWDAVRVLRRQVFAKDNWHLLIQVIVVISVTLACMFAGPIAKISLRTSRTIQKSQLEVLQTLKGDGYTGNLETATELWNETIRSLESAEFPVDQLLDYLPPSTADWTYVASEWNPTWSMMCDYTEEIILHNVTGSGDGTFYDAITAFPTYRNTFNPSWFDLSKFRIQQDFDGWQDNLIAHSADRTNHSVRAAFFFTLIQSDPLVDNRMEANNDTLQLSLSILHAKNFYATNYSDTTEASARIWRPFGTVENASFTRLECNITKKPHVLNEEAIPWIWTNDTYDITMGYAQYWMYHLEDFASKGLLLSPPTPKEILRFYQAYMVTTNTIYASPSLRNVSIWKDTVQLSIMFLVTLIILTSLTLWQSGRYFLFLRRHKAKLREISVPDGKLEWMIHGAKICQNGTKELIDGKQAKDRDHFQEAIFGYSNVSKLVTSDARCRPPALARIYSKRGSISGASPAVRDSITQPVPCIIYEDKELDNKQSNIPDEVEFQKRLNVGPSTISNSSYSLSHEPSPSFQLALKPSVDGNCPSCQCESHSPKFSFQTMVEDVEGVPSINDAAAIPEEEK
ncbi:hypothetical protein B0O99DRAFT_689695 [Bisporella sp. PMI_857]|nr:hypothetical protein B0O99DRAFT_689695 [Bisporella sp. PMI_857]